MEFLCALALVGAELLVLGQLKRVVPALDRDWHQKAVRRGEFLAKVDPVAVLHSKKITTVHQLVLAGAYLSHYVYPIFYVAYLLCFYGERTAVQFAWCFVVSQLVYIFIQINWPVCPPWKFLLANSPPEAGLQDVDQLIGWPLFRNLYAKSPWFDGAMPSGHVLWSALVYFHLSTMSFDEAPNRIVVMMAIAHTVATTNAAVQFFHHYLVDAIVALEIAWVVAYSVSNFLPV
jgi:hypothetical protein